MGLTERFLVVFLEDLITLLSASFLCFFTVRERLKISLIKAMLTAFASIAVFSPCATLLEYYLDIPGNISILAYVFAAFLYYRRAASVEPLKLVFIMLVAVNYMYYATPVALLIARVIHAPITDPDFYLWADIWTKLPVAAVTLPPVAYVMRKKIWPTMRALTQGEWKKLWLLPLTFTLVSVITYYITGEDYLANWYYAAALSLLTACAFACYVIVLRMLQKTEESARETERVRQVDGQLNMQAKRFEEITTHIEEMRLLRHDMRHHMAALQGMLSDGQFDRAKEYLNEYAEAFEETGKPPLCQNFVVDIIARRYAAMAKEQGIDASFLLSLPQEAGIADTDLCIVLGNLIENAMRACRLQSEGRKFLRVKAKVEENKVLIAVDNSMDAVVKQDKSGTGLGLSSVRAIAGKYGGMAGFEQKDGVFQASVLLYRKV